jgi:hypothetical protein
VLSWPGPPRGAGGHEQARRRIGITGSEQPSRGPDASGLSAGITIIAAILLGTGLGYVVGLLVGLPVPLALAGAAAGIVFGFYVVYVKWIRLPKA